MKALFRTVALVALALPALAQSTAPPNDNFASATVMSGAFWLASGSLYGATSEANEPIITGYPNGPTVWWRWTAPGTGRVRVRTWGSEGDTVLAIYRGDTLDTTRLVDYASGNLNRANSAEINFVAQAGETFSIQVLGAEFASPTFILAPTEESRVQVSLTSPYLPPNDNFANAQVLTGATADLVTTTTGANSEPGEPGGLPDALDNSVWFAWTAPSTGVWQLDAQETDFDNLAAVYTGTAITNLTRIDFADQDYAIGNSPYVGGGRVTFGAQAGTTYHFQIQAASISGFEYGNVRLLLQPVQPPANDAFASAQTLSGTAPTAGGWISFATREPQEPPAKTDESRSVWWRWTAPQTGILAVIQYEGTVDAFVGSSLADLQRPPFAPEAVFRNSLGGVTDWYAVQAGETVFLRGRSYYDRVRMALRLVQSPPNDDFADRKTLAGTASDMVDIEYASFEYQEPNTDSAGPQTAWYRWVAPSSGLFVISTEGSPAFTRVYVYTGSVVNALTRVGDESLFGYSEYSYGRVYLNATAGTEYNFQVRRETVVTGPVHISVRPVQPPPNDAFAAAIPMTGSSWSATASNRDASYEENEPGASTSIWWRWTAPANGLYKITTTGSDFSTALAVYTGSAVNALTLVAQDQSSGWGATGGLVLNATSGTTYQIAVVGQARQEGTVKLTLSPIGPPPNDQFAARLVLTGSSAVAAGTVVGATSETGEPTQSGSTGHTVWYEWTAPVSATAVFRVTAPKFDPAFGMFTGNSVASLSPAITGGSGAASQNQVTFQSSYPVNKGTSYKLRVDGAPTQSGDFTIAVTLPSPPINDNFSGRSVLSGAIVHSSANNEGATRQTGEPSHAGISPNFSVWWEWMTPVSGPVTIDTAGSTAQARLAIYTGTAVTNLTPIASATPVFPQNVSSISFNAVAGTSYIIAADSGDRSRGDIALNIVSGNAAAPNDAFANAIVLEGDQAETTARFAAATAEPGEPAHGGRPAARSLWWSWNPRTTRHANIWIETERADFLARIAVYKGTALDSLKPIAAAPADVHWFRLEFDAIAGQPYRIVVDTPSPAADPGWIKLGIVPVNGTKQNAFFISPNSGIVGADTTGAFNQNPLLSPSASRELWWAWVPEVNARMQWRVFAARGTGVNTSVSGDVAFVNISNAATGEGVPGTDEIVGTFDGIPGALYTLKVSTPNPQAVSVQLSEAPQQVPPSNDRQYRAMAMSGTSWSTPVTLGTESDGRLWWTWIAPADGVAQIQLTGALASDDMLLAYADGGNSLTAGASSTDGGPPTLRILSTAGQHWAFATQTNLRRLRAAALSLISPAPGVPPLNDSWLTPQTLLSSWSVVTGNVSYASCQPGEIDHSASGGTRSALKLPPGRSVWFDWTPATGTNAILRLESAAPLALQIYTGRTEPEWQPYAFLPPGIKSLSTYFIGGQTYHIAVATRPPDERTGAFTLRLGAASPNDLLASAVVLAGSSASASADSTGSTAESGEPGYTFTYQPPRGTLWWKWTSPAAGLVSMDTIGSEFDTTLSVFASELPDATARVAENDNLSSRPGVMASAVLFPAVGGQTYLIRVGHADTNEPAGLARLNISLSGTADNYSRWLADWPGLTGTAALETADADGDGVPNLAELAFGSNPLVPDASHARLRLFQIENGFQVEATLNRNALEPATGNPQFQIEWQLSRDLRQWQPGPPSQFVRSEGSLSVERIVLGPGDPPFVRLAIRRR